VWVKGVGVGGVHYMAALHVRACMMKRYSALLLGRMNYVLLPARRQLDGSGGAVEWPGTARIRLPMVGFEV
jgi:hypothetical protein